MIQTTQNKRPYGGARIHVNVRIRRAIRNRIGNLTHAEYASVIHMPRTQLANILSRTQTMSLGDYRRIFGAALKPVSVRVDTYFFRKLVIYWAKSQGGGRQELYKDIAAACGRNWQSVYRMLNGSTSTIDRTLEDYMLHKFRERGFTDAKLLTEIDKCERAGWFDKPKRFSYHDLWPLLEYLRRYLGIAPTRIEKRGPVFYETSPSRTVSERVYSYALQLYETAENALQSGDPQVWHDLKRRVYGARSSDRVPYYQVSPLLNYLETQEQSSKKLLGRTRAHYEKGIGKTIDRRRFREVKRLYVKHKLVELKKASPNATIDDVAKDVEELIFKTAEDHKEESEAWNDKTMTIRRIVSSCSAEQLDAGYRVDIPGFIDYAVVVPIIPDLVDQEMNMELVVADFSDALEQIIGSLPEKIYVDVHAEPRAPGIKVSANSKGHTHLTKIFLEAYYLNLALHVSKLRSRMEGLQLGPEEHQIARTGNGVSCA